jgi:hypothetical protein
MNTREKIIYNIAKILGVTVWFTRSNDVEYAMLSSGRDECLAICKDISDQRRRGAFSLTTPD